jgi:acyl dehydratase
MTGRFRAFEDFEEGATLDLGPKTVTAEEIVDFASQFDMQPMHLDEEAGKASILGGLSASGWHVCAMFMRMLCDALASNSSSQGAPGVDYVRWKRPVLAGDTLTGRATVMAARISATRPRLGLVTLRYEMQNQRGERVYEMQNTVMFLTREAAGL